MIHRDLKPENILLRADLPASTRRSRTSASLAKLADASITDQSIVIGTPSYMSPEQTDGGAIDARSDVYSAGVMLFELLADTKPFHAEQAFAMMRKHREFPFPAFDDVAPDRAIPIELEGVVRRAMAKRPAERYPSAVEMAHALEDAMIAARDRSAEVRLFVNIMAGPDMFLSS